MTHYNKERFSTLVQMARATYKLSSEQSMIERGKIFIEIEERIKQIDIEQGEISYQIHELTRISKDLEHNASSNWEHEFKMLTATEEKLMKIIKKEKKEIR